MLENNSLDLVKKSNGLFNCHKNHVFDVFLMKEKLKTNLCVFCIEFCIEVQLHHQQSTSQVKLNNLINHKTESFQMNLDGSYKIESFISRIQS